jgi:tetratricopeptide (TPR) repeat protein
MKRLGLIAFLLAVAVLTTLAYRYFQREWIVYRKAETLFTDRSYAGAIPFYEELWRQGFQAPGLLKHLGSAYLAVGREEPARAVFERMLARGEARAGTLKELAALYEGRGRFREAAALYRVVLGETPGDHTVRVRLARLLFWSGRLDEAIHQYRIALGEET